MTPLNYKQKWLSALERARNDIQDDTDLRVSKAADASREVSDAVLSLNQARGMISQLTMHCQSLVSEFDESRSVGGLEFAEISHEVDTKLNKLPLHIALRRVRDILKLAEGRVAILSIQCEDLYIANQKYIDTLDKTVRDKDRLHRALIETCYIGDKPTEAELEDFNDTPNDFKRYGLHYADLDENWEDTMLTQGTILREKNSIQSRANRRVPSQASQTSDNSLHRELAQQHAGDDDSDSDSEDEPQLSDHRLARIQPVSPTYTRKNDL